MTTRVRRRFLPLRAVTRWHRHFRGASVGGVDATRSGGVVALVCPACGARGVGATGGGAGVLHGGRSLVQYGQPLTSTIPPLWSRYLEVAAGSTHDKLRYGPLGLWRRHDSSTRFAPTVRSGVGRGCSSVHRCSSPRWIGAGRNTDRYRSRPRAGPWERANKTMMMCDVRISREADSRPVPWR